ncbi:Hepatitis A virus cellular receptor 1 like protein [Fukomys damarensis]|uniref:Hepatitis A virus cellular receptor 1 like protein n=1 Tax=Fukomys damarensis TaxID=885580 RepID=A0A091DVB7_FUKDA|nr:Hepatitis A virus cellular receptor 1 like protein [Fukomys damarensis]
MSKQEGGRGATLENVLREPTHTDPCRRATVGGAREGPSFERRDRRLDFTAQQNFLTEQVPVTHREEGEAAGRALRPEQTASVSMVLHLQAVALGLLLLQTGAVFSTQVSAVVGQLVTLPCTYSVSGGAVTSMCWGRGPCPRNQCSDTLIWTDGHQVTSRKDGRYRLHGQIKQGDVSLTIRNVTVGDSGQYCCRIEVPGWFNDIKRTITLSVVPAPATTIRAPTTRRVSTASPTTAHTQSEKAEITPPVPTQAEETQPTILQETKPQPPTSSPDSGPTGPVPKYGQEATLLSSLYAHGHSEVFEAQNTWMNSDRLYIGILICSLVLLMVLVTIIIKKYFIGKKKTWTISKILWTRSQIPALELRAPAEDNAYIIEENH